jgi:putative glutamine amidotransferase
MSTLGPVPLVGITACLKAGEDSRFHTVQDKYVEAVVVGTGAVPVLIPAIGAALDIESLLDCLDGVLVTGSPSNVDPSHYGGPAPRDGNLADAARDATTLPLIRRALARGVPLLAICRGIQELNVALGGSLHQHVHELPGRRDHRSDKTRDYAGRYAPVHPIDLTAGGKLQEIMGGAPRIEVNSLHAQGIDRLASSLMVEAVAEDGTIEAVSAPSCAGFMIGVQWHPEWRVQENPWSQHLFGAFADSCRRYAAARVSSPSGQAEATELTANGRQAYELAATP